MEARVRQSLVWLPHRVYREGLLAEPMVVPPVQPISVWAMQALWLGLISGWLELGVIAGHQVAVGTVTSLSVRLNWYHGPLGLAAHLGVFAAALGLSVALAGQWSRRWWRDPWVSSLGWFVAVLSPLMALEELHWASSLILASALAATMGPWWVRHRQPLMQRTVVPLVIGTAAFGGYGLVRVDRAESSAFAALPMARSASPNVIMVVLDTVRADHLSLYGYHRRTTPNLEALSRRGVRFEFARSAAPWTLPSHATMFTGRWPHELSVDYDRPLDSTYPTLAESLRDQGYLTGGFVGNTVYCNSWFGLDRGFLHYEDAAENRTISALEAFRSSSLTRELLPLGVKLGLWATDGRYSPRKTAKQVNRDALSWLDRQAADRPFFLFLNYIDAHGPYTIPDRFPRSFSTVSRAELIRANKRAGDHKLPSAERYQALDEIGEDAYDDALRYVDAQIGRLVAELDRRGHRRNTWIIVTADHGEHFGEHGLYIHGNSLLRPLVDVPLLIIPPEGGAEVKVSAPVSLRDLAATVADIAGSGAPAPFPGQSLRHHWDERVATPPRLEPPLSEWKIPAGTAGLRALPGHDRTRTAVVDRGLIYHRDPLGPEALYHIDDRAETVDLTDQPDRHPDLEPLRELGEELRRSGEK